MLIKSAIITMLGALFSFLPITWASSDQCDATYSKRNRILSRHVIATKSFLRNHDCVVLCIEHPSCHSSNYYHRTTMCELNDKTEFSNPEDMVDSPDTIYMTNSLRPLIYCRSDSKCEENSVCVTGWKCKECIAALGMESLAIPDSAITGSSYQGGDKYHMASRGRLNTGPRAWITNQNNVGQEWMQVDLAKKMAVKKVATQGRKDYDQWVKSYKVASSNDGSNWKTYQENDVDKEFQGNLDRDTIVSHVLKQHIAARYFRIYPVTWRDRMSLRAELYGCSLD